MAAGTGDGGVQTAATGLRLQWGEATLLLLLLHPERTVESAPPAGDTETQEGHSNLPAESPALHPPTESPAPLRRTKKPLHTDNEMTVSHVHIQKHIQMSEQETRRESCSTQLTICGGSTTSAAKPRSILTTSTLHIIVCNIRSPRMHLTAEPR